LRAKGNDGGHNGLRNINQVLGRNDYARLRFGIGDDFHKGFQVDYVLSNWTKEEQKEMPEKIDYCIEIIKSFGTIGAERTMNFFNKRK
jgi:PTH1 family peptidyl-tRNA hydrolase